MTVNYTTLLSLGQPVTGTEVGTWGDDVNNAVTSYLDIAIAGTLTLTGDGPVTLANTQGTNSATNIGATTAQYYALKIVGPLSATKVITAPSASKGYVVINTDSTYGVTVKASGQSGVTVAAGTRALVAFNGTDYVLVSSSTVAALGGLGTGVAAALATNVGSPGAVVVNGGALGTPSSGTVTNLTGTANININGTVGATTPNTGAFTTLTSSGNSSIGTGTGNLTVNIASGASVIGSTKIVNIGVGGFAAGTTIITIGAASGTTTTICGTISTPSGSINAGNALTSMTISAGVPGSPTSLKSQLVLGANGVVSISPSDGTTSKLLELNKNGAMSWSGGLYFTNDGRLYGTALHNNAGSVTGTTNQYIASGTYTPTLTSVQNVGSSTASQAQWTRVGNVVTVSGYVEITTSGAYTGVAVVLCGVSLPITSNFTNISNCAGTGGYVRDAGATLFSSEFLPSLYADTTNDRATLNFAAAASTLFKISFQFTYVIL